MLGGELCEYRISRDGESLLGPCPECYSRARLRGMSHIGAIELSYTVAVPIDALHYVGPSVLDVSMPHWRVDSGIEIFHAGCMVGRVRGSNWDRTSSGRR